MSGRKHTPEQIIHKLREAEVELGKVTSLARPELPPAEAEIVVPVAPQPTEWRVTAWTRSQPGMWRFDFVALDPEGRVLGEDSALLEIRH